MPVSEAGTSDALARRGCQRLSKSLMGIATIYQVDKADFSFQKPSLPEVVFAGKDVSKVRIPLSSAIGRKNSMQSIRISRCKCDKK